jgi:hypothetical protein
MTLSAFDLMAYVSLGFNVLEVVVAGALMGYNFLKNRVCCSWHCVRNDVDDLTA